jgi:VanZ family protein
MRLPFKANIAGIMDAVTLRRFVVYVLPLIVWMLVIFGWSTEVGSAEHTRSTLERILSSLPILHDLPDEQILAIDYGIRKAAHIFEYTVLALLAFRAIRQDRGTFRDVDAWGPLALGVLYASTDEYHQTFVASRWPTVGDVLYDSFGVLIGVFATLWWHARTTVPQSRPPAQ